MESNPIGVYSIKFKNTRCIFAVSTSSSGALSVRLLIVIFSGTLTWPTASSTNALGVVNLVSRRISLA